MEKELIENLNLIIILLFNLFIFFILLGCLYFKLLGDIREAIKNISEKVKYIKGEHNDKR